LEAVYTKRYRKDKKDIGKKIKMVEIIKENCRNFSKPSSLSEKLLSNKNFLKINPTRFFNNGEAGFLFLSAYRQAGGERC
jgi:hypothetical protein